jgi:hypothetical protein
MSDLVEAVTWGSSSLGTMRGLITASLRRALAATTDPNFIRDAHPDYDIGP